MDVRAPRGGGADATGSGKGWGGSLRNIPGMGVGTPTSTWKLNLELLHPPGGSTWKLVELISFS